MALIPADRTRDTTTTTGTGALTVSGTAPTGYQTFSAVCATNDTFFYSIQHQTQNEWEVGLGTYTASNEITRSIVLQSSNADAAVNFAAGTKDIFITAPAQYLGPAINIQTDSYTLAATDMFKTVELNKATAVNLTVPPNSSVAFPIPTSIDIVQIGAGQVTVVAGSGVTINSKGGNLKITGQYSGATLYKRATDTWVLIGDLAA